ncbi:MAG: hypothetical protein C4576_22570 [Desulfobacteraceae bacterium]|nr:MAG: hypothetical protein C4576_22570 [Desulfobacteraceae bacterium]
MIMKNKWTKALVAAVFSLFLIISACDQGGGDREERGGGPGVAPEQRMDRPAPDTGTAPPAGQTQRSPSGEREGFSTEQQPKTGDTERPQSTPQRPPAS